MDPNATLRELNDLVLRFQQAEDNEDYEHDPDDVSRLVELIDALDNWMRRGGFAPKAWPPRGKSWHFDANQRALVLVDGDPDGVEINLPSGAGVYIRHVVTGDISAVNVTEVQVIDSDGTLLSSVEV